MPFVICHLRTTSLNLKRFSTISEHYSPTRVILPPSDRIINIQHLVLSNIYLPWYKSHHKAVFYQSLTVCWAEVLEDKVIKRQFLFKSTLTDVSGNCQRQRLFEVCFLFLTIQLPGNVKSIFGNITFYLLPSKFPCLPCLPHVLLPIRNS